MTREEKCQLAIEKGYTYNPETGKIYGIRGNEITTKHSYGYSMIHFMYNKKQYQLLGHQFAFWCINKYVPDFIDHIDGNTSNNRISNLRSVTHQENHFNRTKAKGYFYNKKSNKYIAHIRFNGKDKYLGSFFTEEEAREAYLQAKKLYHNIHNSELNLINYKINENNKYKIKIEKNIIFNKSISCYEFTIDDEIFYYRNKEEAIKAFKKNNNIK